METLLKIGSRLLNRYVIILGLILILGAVGFAVCAAGWLRDVARSHAPAEH